MRRLLALSVLLLLLAAPVSAQQTGRFVLDSTMLSAVTTGSAVLQLDEIRELLLIIECTGTVTAGGVTLEEAYDSAYADTWEPLGVEAVCLSSDSTRTIHVRETYLRAIRARVSTTVTGGGSVTVRLTGR